MRPIVHFATVIGMALVVQKLCIAEPCDLEQASDIKGVSNIVRVFVNWDPDGVGPLPEILVMGGDFTQAGSISANRIVGWDIAGWQAFGPGLDGTVYALAVYRGELVAGGSFSVPGCEGCSNLARWDGRSWQPLGTGTDGRVVALAVYDGALFAGGLFRRAGTTAANFLARWDGKEWAETGLIDLQNGGVTAMAAYQGGLLVGGRMVLPGDAAVWRLARWDSLGWSGALQGREPRFMAPWNNELIIVSGSGSTVVERWDGTTSEVIGNWRGTPQAFVVHEGDVYVGGNFDSEEELMRWNGDSWNAVGEYPRDSDFQAYEIKALASYGGSLFAGGEFYHYVPDRPTTHYVARFDALWRFVENGLVGKVEALFSDGDGLLAASTFVGPGLSTIHGVGRLTNHRWHMMGEEAFGPVHTFSVFQGAVVAGGGFNRFGGPGTRGIAWWDGASWQGFGSGVDGEVYAIEVYRGELVAGGEFPTVGGASAPAIARWNGERWATLGAGMNRWVYALTTWNDELIAGGSFTMAGGVPANRIAAWNGEQWRPMGDGFRGTVKALIVHDGKLIATGGSAPFAWDGESWQRYPSASSLPLGSYNGQLLKLDPYAVSFAIHGRDLFIGRERETYFVRQSPKSPLGDQSADGTLSISDLVGYESCVSGPRGRGETVVVARDCLCLFNSDGDDDVDLLDFAALQRAFGE